jgi:putative membrane protein
MSAKTIIIIVFTVLLTIFLMINTEPVDFDFLITTISISKLIVIGACVLIGFILGFLVGRPRKTVSSYDTEIENKQFLDSKKNQLSDEDRDYIS